MQKKILIIAPNDKHLSSFIYHVDAIKDNSYFIDHFALSYQGNTYPFAKVFHLEKHFPKIFYNKIFKSIVRYIDAYLSFKKIKTQYDLINIHFVTIDSFLLLSLLKKKSKKIMLTPWGSDVLRVSNRWVISCLKKLYKAADYVSLADIRFRQDVVNKFKFANKKIVDLSYGATMIDYISENKMTTEKAKKAIGLDDSFIITAGYNRSPMQNHKMIVQAIVACKNQLPLNLVVVFPFTYNGNIEPYKSELKKWLDEHQIKSVFYESFLEEQMLKNIVYATNLFIHIQETDANSASLQEYILAGKPVINGSWLQYDHLEKITKPYYLAQTKNTIQQSLQEVIDSHYESKVAHYHLEEIKKFGWKQKAKKWDHFFSNL